MNSPQASTSPYTPLLGSTPAPDEGSWIVGAPESLPDGSNDVDDCFRLEFTTDEEFLRKRLEMWDKVNPFDPPDLTKCKLSEQTLRRMRERELLFKKYQQRSKKLRKKKKQKEILKKSWRKYQNKRRQEHGQGPYQRWRDFQRLCKRRGCRVGFGYGVFKAELQKFPKTPQGLWVWTDKLFKIKIDKLLLPVQVEDIIYTYKDKILSRYKF